MLYCVFGCCPQRYFTALICCIGLTISYLMRFSLVVVITEMAVSPQVKEDPNGCPYPYQPSIRLTKGRLYQWTEVQQGVILSSFFWGYVLTPTLGGFISEIYGAKRVLIWGVVTTSIVSIFTPMAVCSWDWIGLIVTRVCIGLSQGVVYAALHTMVAHWIPSEERGTWCTVVFAGAQLGNTLCMLCTSQLIAAFLEWEIVFYVYGFLGLLWTVVFLFTAFSTPVDHPFLTDSEKEVLCIYMARVRKRISNKGTPWKKILTSKPVIAIAIGMFGHDWGVVSLVNGIPKYMKTVLHFNIKQNGTYTAIGHFLIFLVGLLSGIMADVIERRKLLSLNHNRKIMATLATIGPSLGLLGVCYAGCNTYLAMASLILGMAFLGFYYPSLKVNAIDLAPNFAGTVGAVTNTIAGVSGVIAPYIIGVLTPNGLMMEWRLVFWISFFIIMGTNLFYVVFGSATLQSWNDDTEEEPLLRESD